MKKLALILIIFFGVLPLFLKAQEGITGPQECCLVRHNLGPKLGIPECTKGAVIGPQGGICSKPITAVSDDWGACCMMNAISTITNWIFLFFLAFAVILAIVAAFKFLTAGGDADKIKEARTMVLYIVIAIVVAVIARYIPGIIVGILR